MTAPFTLPPYLATVAEQVDTACRALFEEARPWLPEGRKYRVGEASLFMGGRIRLDFDIGDWSGWILLDRRGYMVRLNDSSGPIDRKGPDLATVCREATAALAERAS